MTWHRTRCVYALRFCPFAQITLFGMCDRLPTRSMGLVLHLTSLLIRGILLAISSSLDPSETIRPSKLDETLAALDLYADHKLSFPLVLHSSSSSFNFCSDTPFWDR